MKSRAAIILFAWVVLLGGAVLSPLALYLDWTDKMGVIGRLLKAGWAPTVIALACSFLVLWPRIQAGTERHFRAGVEREARLLGCADVRLVRWERFRDWGLAQRPRIMGVKKLLAKEGRPTANGVNILSEIGFALARALGPNDFQGIAFEPGFQYSDESIERAAGVMASALAVARPWNIKEFDTEFFIRRS